MANAVIERTEYSVLTFPFWRWAVAIDERPDLPAIAFYRRAAAEAFRDEATRSVPDRTIVLLRRTWRGVKVVKMKAAVLNVWGRDKARQLPFAP